MGLITNIKRAYTPRKNETKGTTKLTRHGKYFHQLQKMAEEGKPIDRKLEELYNKRYISRKEYDEWIGMDAEYKRR